MSRKRVERLMRGQGWQGAFVRLGWRGSCTVQDPRATPTRRAWSIAGSPRGTFWLAAVRDAFSNRIVGWANWSAWARVGPLGC